MSHSTHDSCCPERLTIEVAYCNRTNTYRVVGKWCPEQLQLWADDVADLELVATRPEEVRGLIVQVWRHFIALPRLSAFRQGAWMSAPAARAASRRTPSA